MTLIATSPNIVVHEELKAYGYEGFGFFSFTMVGLAILVVVISYMLLVGRRMLGSDAPLSGSANPMRAMEELWNDYRGARSTGGS